jgi:predicted transcriptional regulator
MAKPADATVKELDAIKRLLVLQLLTSGVQATAVAAAMGVAKSAVSRLVPARQVKKKAKEAKKKKAR